MKTWDVVVCGEACIDLIVKPINRHAPLSELGMQRLDSARVTTGGIVPNAGIALARLGLNVGALCVVGNDAWGERVRHELQSNGVDTTHVVVDPNAGTSVTAVLVDHAGEHSFAFYSGASRMINRDICLARRELFANARLALFGYYNLLPNLEPDLASVLAEIRSLGCQSALDAANGGGSLEPLLGILPHLDLYVPSLAEAREQTGLRDPRAMIRVYRQYAPHAILGIKLGEQGAILSPAAEAFVEIQPVQPPGPILDTTGAGDCFHAGLIRGLLAGDSLERAGRLGAAAGACSVTQLGAATGIHDLESLHRLLEPA